MQNSLPKDNINLKSIVNLHLEKKELEKENNSKETSTEIMIMPKTSPRIPKEHNLTPNISNHNSPNKIPYENKKIISTKINLEKKINQNNTKISSIKPKTK